MNLSIQVLQAYLKNRRVRYWGWGGCEGAKDNPTPFYVAQESGGEKRLFIFCQAIDIYFLSV
jgi:hypothetical protein